MNSLKTCSRGFMAAQYTHQVLILVIVLLTTTATAQWDTQSPVPTHLDIRGIGVPTTERVFIATEDNSFDEGGSLFESTDGGATWIQRNIPLSLSNPLNGIFFLDSQNGWTYGNDNYRTTDGGTTWTQLPFLGSIYFMEFYSTNFGLATENSNYLISYDAGDSWVESPNGMFTFDFADNQFGIGVAGSGLYRTTDGGTTFTPVHSGTGLDAAFLSSTIAVSIVDDTFIRSTDGGATWTKGADAEGRDRLIVLSADVVLASGRSGTFPDFDERIFRSSDGGQTWSDLGEVIPAGIFAFAVADQQTVIVSDLEGNMFRSSDAGLNWAQTFISPGPQPSFLSSATPVFANSQTGYFGFGSGFVIKTTDGGASWFQISSGSGQSLNDIDRFANGNMIAVGDNGTLITSNGVSSWIIHQRLSQYDIKAVQVIDQEEVIVVDEVGQIYKSSDGGTTWSAASTTPPSLSPAKDLHFTTLLDGWVIGQGSIDEVLYHTTNGGDSWTPGTGNFGGAYIAVDFENARGWALNVGGPFYYSIDNGISWTQGELPGFPIQISDMDFFDESIGYAVGWGGYAARSNDGGVTWEVLPTPNENDNFTDIYLIGANELWLSTNDNVAYYSANGGQNWAILEMGSAGFGPFNAIAASPDGNAWSVGFQGYIEHFTGPPPPPLNRPPDASFNFSASGLIVNFNDTSTDPDGFIVSWRWDFDDGTGSTEQHTTHTFDTANTYIVRLTVTDDDGDSSTTGQIIVVQPNPGGIFGDFTEVTPLDSIFVTPQDEDFWVITTAPADYDGDGDLDIAVLGYYVVYNQSVEERLVLLVNNGPVDSTEWNFNYVNVPLDGLHTGESDMAWGDADGDGDQDLAVGTDGVTVIYRNDAGTLVLSDSNLPGYWEDNSQAEFDLRSITWADFDNDGDLDILIPSVFVDSTFSYKTVLMRNDSSNGTGGIIFTEMNSVFAPTSHANSTWADYDNDQDLDLLLVNMAPNTDEGFIRRYRNDGNGTFVGEDILGILTIEHGEAQWGDYDSDGDLDILVAGNIKEIDGTYKLALRIYRNDEDSYIPVEVISCIPCEGWFDLTAATWADYDSDGDMDILLAGNYNSGSYIEGRARIYTNDGNGVFTVSDNELPAPTASGDRGGTFSWLDIDGEGDLDYFIAGQYFVPGGNNLVEAQMHVYRNDAEGQNDAPSTPTGLNVIIVKNGIHTPTLTTLLSWLASSDDHTPSVALTYDLTLFRNSAPVEIPPQLPQPGNVSAVTEWLLTGLQEGHYEWIVRAVDAAYIGGPVAKGVFSIGIQTTIEPEDNVPSVYSVAQNYPNPFNPRTTIKYSIPKEGLVKLKLYNAIGEEIATLVDMIKHVGNYEVTFDATNLSSGVYFYKLQAGDFSQVKKMMLTK